MTFPPVIGKDGHLYYNYNVGAKVRMWDGRGEYELQIIDCEYINDKEYYQVARDGIPQLSRVSVNRLTFLLNHNQIMTLELGEPRELPLSSEEVRIFADYQRRQYDSDKERVLKQLESTGYDALQREYNSVAGRQAIAESRGDIDAATKYTQRMTEIEKRMESIMRKEAINLHVFDKKPCPYCGDTGFVNGSGMICRCMKANKARIKEYCASLRK